MLSYDRMSQKFTPMDWYVCFYLSSCNLLMQSDMFAVLIGLRRSLLLSWWGVSVCGRGEGIRKQRIVWRLISGQVMVGFACELREMFCSEEGVAGSV
jgi:hypothetical protein